MSNTNIYCGDGTHIIVVLSQNLSPVTTITLGNPLNGVSPGIYGMALTGDGATLYAHTRGIISQISTASNTVSATAQAPTLQIYSALVLSADESLLYATGNVGGVDVYTTSPLAYQTRFGPTEIFLNSPGIGQCAGSLSPDGKTLVVSAINGSTPELLFYDLGSNTLAGSYLPLSVDAFAGTSYDPSGDVVYMGLNRLTQSQIDVVSASSFSLLETLTITAPSSSASQDIFPDLDGESLWCSDSGTKLVQYALPGLGILKSGSVSSGAAFSHFTQSPDDQFLYGFQGLLTTVFQVDKSMLSVVNSINLNTDVSELLSIIGVKVGSTPPAPSGTAPCACDWAEIASCTGTTWAGQSGPRSAFAVTNATANTWSKQGCN
ncbi:MAG TPA: hypothetical protein VFW40_02705 [Capsulimonadaceae bacterium]|nr:hypothetical protein [Capsulimonadaceae bacterium]